MAASVSVLRYRLRLRAGLRALHDAARFHGAPDALVRIAGALPVIVGDGGRTRRRLGAFACTLVLGIGAGVVRLPFVWMLMTSLQAPPEIFPADFRLFPAAPPFQDSA